MGAGSSDRIVAADRIAIYSQDSAWEGIGYSGSTLKEYGCGLFTVHHAMQWVGIDPVPSPAAMAETDRKRGFFSNEASYFTRSAGVHGYSAEDLWSSCYELEPFRNRLTQVFARGGAVTLHVSGINRWSVNGRIDGHYLLGVGISDDGCKVHVVDSSAGTTLGVVRDTTYNAYYHDGSAFIPLDKGWDIVETIRAVSFGRKSAYASGCEYWVDIGFIRQQQAFYDASGSRADACWTVAIFHDAPASSEYSRRYSGQRSRSSACVPEASTLPFSR
ncbi:MAG: hypothetical protein IKE76_12450 [Clostridia bacterium]|nr:hypothetical protein [Clostridia bacterium]